MSFERPRILNAQDLRAMSHPLRLRLLDLLELDGPLTATEAAVQLETTPANCSFHLRLLAKHGFVEEAPGGTGRQRPWRVIEELRKITSEQLDPESLPALRALDEFELEQFRQIVTTWWKTRDSYPPEWRTAAARINVTAHLTGEELAELKRKLVAVLDPYVELGRTSNRRPGTTPAMINLTLVPLRKPEVPDA